MTVTVDAATEHVRTGTTSPQTFSHAGAASGVKGVLLALVHGTSSTDHVTAASYGGVAMTRIQRNVDTATEPGAAEWWFLGASVPQGTQTVSYTPGSTTDDFHAVAITLLGADDLEIVDQDGISENAANPSVTLQYGGRTCMAFAALYGGGAAPSSFTPNANCTTVHDHDLGAFYSEIIRQTTAGSADFAVGGTASSDDVAFAAIAVSEVLSISPTRGLVSWAELETPLVPTRGRLSWAELETPLAPTRGRLSWSELEVPGVPTRGLVSWSELEVPLQATRGRISWAELEAPLAPTRGRISWAELEAPLAPTRGRASFAELEVPAAATRGRISFAELEVPAEGAAGRVVQEVGLHLGIGRVL